jgi:Holliday junction resolvasome RuvABC endonuclease subunit
MLSPNQNNLFALDLSLSCCGVSVFDGSGNIIKITSVSTNEKLSHGGRLREIYEFLGDLDRTYHPKTIVIEDSFYRFNKATSAIYKVRGVTELLFSDCEFFFYTPAKIKKVVGGSGRLIKEQLRELITEKFGVKTKNLDESDSFCVGLTHFMVTSGEWKPEPAKRKIKLRSRRIKRKVSLI